ncbi:MAG: hypothetical protein RQ824_00080 [bacterium]|nr:hypothetical protein [bacterium]
MGCCEDKRENEKDPELVECETCKMKTGRSVVAVMYLRGDEHFFCSHQCQDRWESLHPDKLW